MMDPLRKVIRGEPRAHSASAHNAVVDMVRQAQTTRQVNQVAGVPLGPTPAGMVLVRNNTGSSLQRFYALALGEPVFGPEVPDEFENRVCFNLLVASSQTQVGCILQQPLAVGAIGYAVVYGVCVTGLLVVSTGHRFANIGVSGGFDVILRSVPQASQFEILYKELASTGVYWAVVRVGRRQA